MNVVAWVHITGGSLGLLSGAVAVAARKGGPLHARAGTLFCASMLVLGATAAMLARLNEEPDSGIGGILTCYFVATSWATARRRDGTTGRFEIIACAVALSAAATMAWSGLATVAAPTPAGRGPVFALAGVCLLAGAGDLKAILRKKLSANQRISRHLWRMCFAFFIATGSFFLGQQDVMPEAVRGSPVLFVLAFAPFALMAFWLVRIRFRQAAGSRSGFSGCSVPVLLHKDPERNKGEDESALHYDAMNISARSSSAAELAARRRATTTMDSNFATMGDPEKDPDGNCCTRSCPSRAGWQIRCCGGCCSERGCSAGCCS